MSNIITFPAQPATSPAQYAWSDFTRLGKATVIAMLEEQGIEYDASTSYFGLCSLLYRNQKVEAQVIDLAQKRRERAQKAVVHANSRDEYLLAVLDEAKVRIREVRLQSASARGEIQTRFKNLIALSDKALAKYPTL